MYPFIKKTKSPLEDVNQLIIWKLVNQQLALHPHVMVNFMFQLGGCFWMRLTFNLVDSEEADCPPSCGWTSSNELKAWIEQKDQPPWLREFCLLTLFAPLVRFSWISACWPYFKSGLASPHNHMSQLLKIISLYMVYIHAHICTHAIGFVSLKKPNI